MLYAAIRALGGEGIIQYQATALLSATATALVVNRLARCIAPPAGAFWAGVAYLLYLSAFNCFGGQAPVFYNLLMALGAWAMIPIMTRDGQRRLLARGCAVMALVGIAIQLKYTVLFEGGFFGLALLYRAYVDGQSRARIGLSALIWIAVALAPTALAFATYAALGHGAAFWFANFQSIFARQEPFLPSLGRLVKEMAVLIPLWLAIFHAPGRALAAADGTTGWGTAPGNNPAALGFLQLWAAFAMAGFLVFGSWYDHYVAPLLMPLAILAAPMLGRKAQGLRIYTGLMLGVGIIAAAYTTIHETTHHASTAQVRRITALIKRQLGHGCAYLNEGDPVLYLTTGSCILTPYIFPNHLSGTIDVDSLGINVDAEMARIMARRPSVVMISADPISKPTNWPSRRILLAALARDYTRYAVARGGYHDFELFRLKPGLSPGKPG